MEATNDPFENTIPAEPEDDTPMETNRPDDYPLQTDNNIKTLRYRATLRCIIETESWKAFEECVENLSNQPWVCEEMVEEMNSLREKMTEKIFARIIEKIPQ